jgi:acetate kinase
MKILVINSGSSSLKYSLFETPKEEMIISGAIDRLGLDNPKHKFRSRASQEVEKEVKVKDHGEALDEVLRTISRETSLGLDQIDAVAHRLAHGGKYREARIIDDQVMAEAKRMTPMIPLHHPPMIREIEECFSRMPNSQHVAVFDTWFHSTIPDEAAIYGIPYRYFKEKGYRKTGFHGNSHAYVSQRAAEFLEKDIGELRIITCHLGNGASLCAIDRGSSIDTTLGMTAVPGVIMGTRCGDVDPGLLPVIMKEDSLAPDDMINLLYKESGLKGISGISRDMRDIEAAAAQGNARAKLAFDAFCYSVKRLIGQMLIALGGCDCLVYCGGIGTNSPTVRAASLKNTEELGFVLDKQRNESAGPESQERICRISSDESKVVILAAQTFEEIMMARQCVSALERTE